MAKKNCYLTLHVDAPGYALQYIKLGHYYGYNTFLLDSVQVGENDQLSFADSLHPGIYLLITPTGSSHEFMIAKSGALHITLPQAGMKPATLHISGNEISEAFNDYLGAIDPLEIQVDSLRTLADREDDHAKDIAYQRASRVLRDSMNRITSLYIEGHENSLLAHYLRALLPAEIPTVNVPPYVSNPDSFRWVRSHAYYQQQYLSNVSFSDNGLIYTPVLEDKVTTYLTKLIEQIPQSIVKAIDTLLSAVEDPEVYQYITELLLDKYYMSRHKALEEYVYLHIIREYYLAGKTPWAGNRKIRLLTDEYNRRKPASLFQSAPEILLPDQAGVLQSLAGIEADYLVVIFWDYDCPYCRRALEDIKKVLQKYSDRNVQVYTVFTGEDTDVWKAFLARKIPREWTNTRLNKNYAIVHSYNISETPAIFLLNADKIIVSKNLTASAMGSYLENIPGDKQK